MALVVVPAIILWNTQMKRQSKIQAFSLLSFASLYEAPRESTYQFHTNTSLGHQSSPWSESPTSTSSNPRPTYPVRFPSHLFQIALAKPTHTPPQSGSPTSCFAPTWKPASAASPPRFPHSAITSTPTPTEAPIRNPNGTSRPLNSSQGIARARAMATIARTLASA